MEYVFNDIHRHHKWIGGDSHSGTGSSLLQTVTIRQALRNVLQELNAKSLLDAPCGDFHWMKELELERYIGVDVVSDLIAQNQQKYGTESRQFLKLNISEDPLPQVDVILCRDGLVHFSFKDIISVVRNFKRSGSRCLLTTTFPKCSRNRDIITGGWRPINLHLAPFNFPKPVQLINEGCADSDGKYSDKSLGLWELEDIRL